MTQPDERGAALADGFRVGIEAAASYLDGVAAMSAARAAAHRAYAARASSELRAALATLHERAASFATREARCVRDLPMPPSMPAALRAADEAQRRQRDALEDEFAALVFDADDRARRAEAGGAGVADWRPFPSAAEVLAHANRTGVTFAPWLFVLWPEDGHGCARVVRLAADAGAVVAEPAFPLDYLTNPVGRWRPVALLGEAMLWPRPT